MRHRVKVFLCLIRIWPLSAAGWGDSDNGESTKLRSVRVSIFSEEYCYEYANQTANDMDHSVEFCAGSMKGGKDTCQGDR